MEIWFWFSGLGGWWVDFGSFSSALSTVELEFQAVRGAH